MSYEKLRSKLANSQGKVPQSTPTPAFRKLPMSGIVRRIGGAGKTVFSLIGVGALASAALEYKWERDMEESRRAADANDGGGSSKDVGSKEKKKERRVLVLPFYRMKVVERKRFDVGRVVGNLLQKDADRDDESPIEIEVKELVDTIHAAASDPEIVGLYGVFGHGHGFSCGGFAHVEEIRNAIRVFNESHRVHREPNIKHDMLVLRRNGEPKPSYAFADTFGHPLDSGNKEYYLASEFTHVQMQPQGELNLFGLGISTPFLRSALDKYGIKAHVFKHGKYKNAPNSATEKGYTKGHLENTMSIVKSINDNLCLGVVRSRSLPDTIARMWDAIHNYGSLTGLNAKEIGLIDHLPRIDPLESLLYANKSDDSMKEMKEKWSNEIDMGSFSATKSVSLREYSVTLEKRKRSEARKWKRYDTIKHLAEKSSATELLLSLFQYKAPNYNIDMDEFVKSDPRTKEKIALVHVLGGINDRMAKKITNTLRKIKKEKDIKCVILRVDSPGGSVVASEAIFQECKDLPQPVICSMSNTAASGGYYVAAHCDRIFALPTTVTGSIGVFGVKFDITGLARDYGVNVEHVTSGQFSTANSPFQPLTPKVKANFCRNMDRIYAHFKRVVSSGRNLSLHEVEERAQGRVWTGDQARENGLVDELGGLNRAISYAKLHYTSTGEADVEVWPKKPTFKEKLQEWMDKEMAAQILELVPVSSTTNTALPGVSESDLVRFLLGGGPGICAMNAGLPLIGVMDRKFATGILKPHIMLVMDEAAAIDCVLQDTPASNYNPPPPSFWM